MCFHALIELS
uniref:Uncharacterized protein n=1 Tax=Anguilla anguilla TaxID=7936 RepID=A0A0E9TK30_ANGAN